MRINALYQYDMEYTGLPRAKNMYETLQFFFIKTMIIRRSYVRPAQAGHVEFSLDFHYQINPGLCFYFCQIVKRFTEFLSASMIEYRRLEEISFWWIVATIVNHQVLKV